MCQTESSGVRFSVSPIFFVYFNGILCFPDNNWSLSGKDLTETIKENNFLPIY